MSTSLKKIVWVGSSRDDLLEMPSDVKDVFGYALHQAQSRQKSRHAKPLTGFAGAGVLEVVDDFDGNTFRAVYTVKFEDAVYVLHCFQKKSKTGIATSKQDIELIRKRLATAKSMSEDSRGQKK